MNKISFVFSGQGVQYPGMCKEIYNKYGLVKDVFDKASMLLGFDLAETCFNASNAKLQTTQIAQLAIFTASVAQEKLFVSQKKIKPMFLAGNSVGEYAALVSGGVLTFEDALMLVRARAEYMDEAAKKNSGTMYAVSDINFNIVKEFVDEAKKEGIVCISNINGKDNIVISGEVDCVNKVIEKLNQNGARTMQLKVASGFHSPLMKEACEKFKKEIQKYNFKEPQCMIISNITGEIYKDAKEIQQSLPEQIISSVKWYKTMILMESYGCKVAIEFGARSTLRNLINNNTSIKAYSFDSENDQKVLKTMLSKKEEIVHAFGEFLGIVVSTKNKNNNNNIDEYNKNVCIPYREIEKIYIQLRDTNYEITINEIKFCKEQLLKILSYKGVCGAEEICEKVYKNIEELIVKE